MNRTDYARQRQLDAIRANPSAALNSPYSMTIARQGGLDVQSLVATQQAQAAGFKSPEAQSSNRMARDILEMKADAAGIPYAEAYKAAGSDLTNTDAIIKAYQGIPNQPVTPPGGDGGGGGGGGDGGDGGGSDYRDDADDIVSSTDDLVAKILAGIPDYSAQMQQLRDDMAASQRTLAANMSIASRTPNLQIQPASGTPDTAGTQSFRRRQRQFGKTAGTVLAGLNLGQPNTMNV